MNRYYAGIGSRNTPTEVKGAMAALAARLLEDGL